MIPAEHDTGQIGLARLKSFDSRFNFYPAFPTGRSLVLDSLAGQIYRIMVGMEAQRKKIKAKHHVEPCSLSRGKREYKRWERITTKLMRKIQEYGRTPPAMLRLARADARLNPTADAASVNAKTVNEYECPREEALKKLQDWLNKQNNAQRHLYNGQDVDAFRMLGPKRGPIEKFVHETLPVADPTGFLLVRRQGECAVEDFLS